MSRCLPLLLAGWFSALSIFADPAADNIIEQFIAASETKETAERRNSFRYERSTLVEKLDEKGAIRKLLTRVYLVEPRDGEPVARLVSINGKPPTREEEEEPRSAARENGERSRSLDISAELLGRYEFTRSVDEVRAGRPVYALDFKPKSGAPAESMFDRLLNAMHGTLYIDQEDHQLCSADIRLLHKVTFFKGIAGALEKFNLVLTQKRLEPGVWLPHTTFIDFDGRKLFSDVRFRYHETCAEYQPPTP